MICIKNEMCHCVRSLLIVCLVGVTHQMATRYTTTYITQHTDRVFERDTTASFLPRLNASNASRSFHLAVPGVLEIQLTCHHHRDPLYTIFDLYRGVNIGIVPNDNKHKRLARLLQQQILDPTCDIDSDVSMGDAAKT